MIVEKYATSRCVKDYDNFVKCKNNLRKLTRSLKEVIERKLAINSKNKPKPFCSYVFSKLKTRVRIPTLSKVDGVKAQTAQEKAEALNNFFASVYLFVIFINDMPNLVRSSCNFFAADAKIYTSTKTNTDKTSLQGDIMVTQMEPSPQ